MTSVFRATGESIKGRPNLALLGDRLSGARSPAGGAQGVKLAGLLADNLMAVYSRSRRRVSMWLAVFIVAGLSLLWSLGRGPNAVWGGATLGLVVGLIWGFVVGEGFALILRGAAVGAVAGVGSELLAMILKTSGAGACARQEREAHANLTAMGLDPDNLPVPGSPEYDALVRRLSGQVVENSKQERKAS